MSTVIESRLRQNQNWDFFLQFQRHSLDLPYLGTTSHIMEEYKVVPWARADGLHRHSPIWPASPKPLLKPSHSSRPKHIITWVRISQRLRQHWGSPMTRRTVPSNFLLHSPWLPWIPSSWKGILPVYNLFRAVILLFLLIWRLFHIHDNLTFPDYSSCAIQVLRNFMLSKVRQLLG